MKEKFIIEKNWLDPHIIESDEPFEMRYPHAIQIELMDICNLHCTHCYLETEEYKKNRTGLISFDFFVSMMNRLEECVKNTTTIAFTMVEALMHPNIFDMFDLVLKMNPNIGLKIATNGILLTERRVKLLKEYEMKMKNTNGNNPQILVSVDGYKKETVEKIKTGVSYDKLMRGMKMLKKYKVPYHVSFVVMKDNIDELIDLIPLCKELGASSIRANPIMVWESKLFNESVGIYSDSSIDKVDEYYKKCEKLANSLDMNFYYRRTYFKPMGCGFSSYTMYITMDRHGVKGGDIVPCQWYTTDFPFSMNKETTYTNKTVWGNIFDEDPYKIWTGKKSVDFRRVLHEKRLPDACKGCPQGELGST